MPVRIEHRRPLHVLDPARRRRRASRAGRSRAPRRSPPACAQAPRGSPRRSDRIRRRCALQRHVLLEAAALLGGVGQFAEGVGEFDAAGVELEAFGDARVVRVEPRQRRLAGGIIARGTSRGRGRGCGSTRSLSRRLNTSDQESSAAMRRPMAFAAAAASEAVARGRDRSPPALLRSRVSGGSHRLENIDPRMPQKRVAHASAARLRRTDRHSRPRNRSRSPPPLRPPAAAPPRNRASARPAARRRDTIRAS